MTSRFQPLMGALLMICALVLTSCGGDDEVEELINVSNLTGATWTFDSIQDAADTDSSVGLGFFAPLSLSFSDDNTFAGVALDGEFEGEWSYAENTLIFEDEENPVSFEVRELTSGRMILFFDGPVMNPATEEVFELTGSIVYTR